MLTVFFTELPKDAAEKIATFAPYLQPDEVPHADRLARDQDRQLYLTARALLRHALQSMTGRTGWRTQMGPHGKPLLLSADGETPPHFNLSHTSGLVACAVSPFHDVGVDVEKTDRTVDVLSIAEHWFADSECRYLEGLPPDRRLEAFFRLWTIKEAITKAMGLGLALPLAHMVLTLDPPSLSFAPGLAQDPTRWQVEEFQPTPAHRMAVAASHPDGPASTVRWQATDFASL